MEGGGKVGGGGVKEVNGTHLPSFTHMADNDGSTTCRWSSAILPIPNHTKYKETHVIKTETYSALDGNTSVPGNYQNY